MLRAFSQNHQPPEFCPQLGLSSAFRIDVADFRRLSLENTTRQTHARATRTRHRQAKNSSGSTYTAGDPQVANSNSGHLIPKRVCSGLLSGNQIPSPGFEPFALGSTPCACLPRTELAVLAAKLPFAPAAVAAYNSSRTRLYIQRDLRSWEHQWFVSK